MYSCEEKGQILSQLDRLMAFQIGTKTSFGLFALKQRGLKNVVDYRDYPKVNMVTNLDL